METKQMVYAKNREEWRKWLSGHYKNEKEVWLVYYKKQTDKPSVSYIDAVEEALCFGWIDGQIKSLDKEKYMQRFTPRKPASNWSTTNIERVKKMIDAGKMTSWGRKIYEDGIKTNQIVPSSKKFSVPLDFKNALIGNKKAWKNFGNFSPSAQLAFVYWITTAKTDETRLKRIKQSVKLLSEGKRLY